MTSKLDQIPDDVLLKELEQLEEQIYNLSSTDVIRYTKLKLEAIRRNLIKNEDKEVIEENKHLLQAITPENTELLESEREAIRRCLFNKQRKVNIAQRGTSFIVKQNDKTQVCQILIPSTWKVNLDQGLILEHLENVTKEQCVPKSIDDYIILQLKITQDVAVVAKKLELLQLTNSHLKDQLHTEPHPVLDPYILKVLSVLGRAVNEGDITYEEAKVCIGHRRRLFDEFLRLLAESEENTKPTKNKKAKKSS